LGEIGVKGEIGVNSVFPVKYELTPTFLLPIFLIGAFHPKGCRAHGEAHREVILVFDSIQSQPIVV
jgi:hypothetical protein